MTKHLVYKNSIVLTGFPVDPKEFGNAYADEAFLHIENQYVQCHTYFQQMTEQNAVHSGSSESY